MGNEDATASNDLEASLLMARDVLTLRRGRDSVLPAVDGVIVTHQGALFRALAPRLRSRAVRGLSAPLRLVKSSDGNFAIAGGFGVGGPATAVLVEELAALGVRRLVSLDIAAGLTARRSSSSVVLATSALTTDGTSKHYTNAPVVNADAASCARLEGALRANGIPYEKARVASTDAPFRETASLLASFRDSGAELVDMETAAFYASAAALDVAAASLLVVADSFDERWHAPAAGIDLAATLRWLAPAVIAALRL